MRHLDDLADGAILKTVIPQILDTQDAIAEVEPSVNQAAVLIAPAQDWRTAGCEMSLAECIDPLGAFNAPSAAAQDLRVLGVDLEKVQHDVGQIGTTVAHRDIAGEE